MNPFNMSNRTYDWVKHLVQVVLPAAGAAYFSLSNFWNLPNSEAVVGTVTILATFLGVVLNISHNAYVHDDARFDGLIEHEYDEDGMPKMTLIVDEDLLDLREKGEISLKVVPHS